MCACNKGDVDECVYACNKVKGCQGKCVCMHVTKLGAVSESVCVCM